MKEPDNANLNEYYCFIVTNPSKNPKNEFISWKKLVEERIS